jgi:DNA-binding LacI/PurR family transcriptional regulator
MYRTHSFVSPRIRRNKRVKVANELLNLPEPPTAIFAATDFQALGVLKAARQLGFQGTGTIGCYWFR